MLYMSCYKKNKGLSTNNGSDMQNFNSTFKSKYWLHLEIKTNICKWCNYIITQISGKAFIHSKAFDGRS